MPRRSWKARVSRGKGSGIKGRDPRQGMRWSLVAESAPVSEAPARDANTQSFYPSEAISITPVFRERRGTAPRAGLLSSLIPIFTSSRQSSPHQTRVLPEVTPMLKLLLRRFAGDRSGNFVILFALALVPMMGLMGLAVDYSLALRTKTALDASTDAAVLAATTEAEQIIQTYSSPNYDATPLAKAAGEKVGHNVFTADAAMLHTASPPTLTLNLDRPNNGQTITATASYNAKSPTFFGKMFGTTALNTNGIAHSSLTLPKYLNFYVAVDVSQSMGIASTQNYMNQLAKLTPNNCVFGCHVTTGNTPSNEQIAHNNNILLRIDVLKNSIQNMIDQADAINSRTASAGRKLIETGLYTLQAYIQNDGAQNLVTLQTLTADHTALTSAASNLDLGNNDSSGVGDSNFSSSLTQLASLPEMSASGDGSGQNNPKSFLFIMTDGVDDVYGNCTDGHCTAPLDPRLCQAFKDKGITVGVVYNIYSFSERADLSRLSATLSTCPCL